MYFATEQQREAHELMGKLTDRIEKLISEAEEAGCSGEVEEVNVLLASYQWSQSESRKILL